MLRAIYDNGHQVLDEFVHGGVSMVAWRTDGRDVSPRFTPEMEEQLLHSANVLATVSAIHLMDLTGDSEIPERLVASFDKYYGTEV